MLHTYMWLYCDVKSIHTMKPLREREREREREKVPSLTSHPFSTMPKLT